MMKYGLAFCIIFWACVIRAFAALAQPVDIFPPLAGLTVSGLANSATTPAANWRVSLYSAPAPLGPFHSAWWGGYEADSGGAYPSARGSYNPAAGRAHIYQSGALLSCAQTYGSGATLVTEYDEQLSPNSVVAYTPLAGLKHAMMRGSVRAVGYAETDAECGMNVAVVSDALTLYDGTSKQTLFFQVKIGAFGAQGEALPASPDNKWFFTGKNSQTGAGQEYGYDGSAADFDAGTVQAGRPYSFNFDILPQLLMIIAQGGQYGMDTNLAHWEINGAYPGTAIFGKVSIESWWTGLALVEQ